MQIYSGRRSNLALPLAIEGSLAMHTFPWDPVTLTQHLGYGLIPKAPDPNS